MSDVIPVTVKGKAILEERLKEYENRMPDVREAIAEAREKGDLSENAEYHAAREQLGMLEAHSRTLRGQLARAQVIDSSRAPKDKVAFGATVNVKNVETGQKDEYVLVGLGEEDMDKNFILTSTPVAQGLMLKKVGDIAEIKLPKGTAQLEILSIEYKG